MLLCLTPGRPFDLFYSPCTPMVLREPLMLGLNCPDVNTLLPCPERETQPVPHCAGKLCPLW